MKIRILFISHSSEQTGAPTIMLELMRWLDHKADVEMDILTDKVGVLTEQFSQLAKVFKYQDGEPEKKGNCLQRYGQRLFSYHKKLLVNLHIKYALRTKKYDVIYCNSIFSLPRLDQYFGSYPPSRLLLHVHEHKFMFEAIATEKLRRMIDSAARIIVPSKATWDMIHKQQNIPEERMGIVNGFIDIAAKKAAISDDVISRKELGIPEDAVIIGGTGNDVWIKGADHFIRLASRLRNKTSRKLKFIWVGGSDYYVRQRQLDIDKSGLADDFINLGHVSNPMPYFNLFNIFFLSSREESFCTACLEVGLCDVPVICFQNSGGSSEFIHQGGGVTVPYSDMAELERATLGLINDDDVRRKSGSQFREWVVLNHDVTHQAPKIFDIIQSIYIKKNN